MTKYSNNLEFIVCVVIKGITADGKTFRPSNWAERLQSLDAIFDVRMKVHRPTGNVWICRGTDNGIQLKVRHKLQQENCDLFEHILDFAKLHNLQVYEQEAE